MTPLARPGPVGRPPPKEPDLENCGWLAGEREKTNGFQSSKSISKTKDNPCTFEGCVKLQSAIGRFCVKKRVFLVSIHARF